MIQPDHDLVQMASALLSLLEGRHNPDSLSKPSLVTTTKSKSINDFPDEILLKILSHFGPEELCLTIAKVCERWNSLARDVTLWKTLSYRCDNFTECDTIVQILSEAPVLQSFIIYNRKDAPHLLKRLFGNCDDLKKLILKFCSLGEDSTGILANIVAFYPDLEVLTLEGCHPLNYPGYSLIPRLQKLSGLNLSHCKGLNGKAVRGIVESCRHLKKLSLDDITQIFDDDVKHIIEKLGGQLITLILDGEDLTDVAYLYLRNCSRLQELEVSFCDQMTDKGLLEGIGLLQELYSLRLKRGHNLTAQALSTFLHRPAMACVVCLNLSECSNLDDHGLEGIAKRCTLLKKLTLQWCWEVTDAGIMMIISHCGELRELDLLGVVRITGIGYFALVPSFLPHLRLLNLKQCNNVSDDSLAELVNAVPELVVINYYGDRVLVTEDESKYGRSIEEEDIEFFSSNEEDL